MDGRAVQAASYAVAELERVATVTLLIRPMGLGADFVRVHHDRLQLERGQEAGGEERDGPGFQRHRSGGRQGEPGPQAFEARAIRGDPAAPQDGAVGALHDEYALTRVHVQTYVVLCHWAVLLSLQSWGSSWMTPWFAADLTAVRGGQPASSSIRLAALGRALRARRSRLAAAHTGDLSPFAPCGRAARSSSPGSLRSAARFALGGRVSRQPSAARGSRCPRARARGRGCRSPRPACRRGLGRCAENAVRSRRRGASRAGRCRR